MSNDESGLMGPVTRVSVGSLYKLEVTEEKKSQIYHRIAMNQKCNIAIKETNVIL